MGDESTDDYADTEYLYNQLMAPALASAVNALGLAAGQRVLDAGCGPGGVLPLLCAAIGPAGAALGLDASAPHVARARRLVQAKDLQAVATIGQADLLAALPVAPQSCDAVWIADVLYPETVGDPAAVVARLSQTLKPGGALAIFYGDWLRPHYLPGYARLEHLICAARETRYAREQPGQPWSSASHPERPLGWLMRAGLTDCALRVFPVIYTQPLPAAVRQYITTAIFGGHYADAVATCAAEVGMNEADMDLWRRLADPANPDFILDQPDYYCTVTPLLALGRRAP